MRYRVNNYGLNVNNVNHRLMIYFDAPEGYIDEDSGKTLAEQMKEAVRLVVDETAKIVFTSSMQKDKILTIDTTTGQTGFGYRMIFDIPTGKTVTVNDLFTLEFDFGDAPGASPSADQLAAFFGLPEALPEIEVATEQEVKDINDDVMGALYGYGKVTVTMHSLMRIGTAQNSQSSQNSEQSQNSESSQNSENAQNYVTQDLASVIYVDPNESWAENGYPTLYDDEGEPIDTTSNPAAGDEVFNYQIQSES